MSEEQKKPVQPTDSPAPRKKALGERFRGLFYNNYFLMAFSVLIAFAIWMGISFSDTTTEMTRTIRGVRLEYSNLPDSVTQLGLTVIDTPANVDKVDVTITGKQYIVSQVTAEDLSAYIRLSDVTSATNYTAEVKVVATGRNKDFTIQKVDPQIVNVRLDRMTTKEYTLSSSTNEYNAAEGYTLKTPILRDTTVVISGPATDMQQIARVVAEATVPDEIDKTATYSATIHLYDEYGQEINNSLLELNTAQTELTIVAMRLKAIPLELEYQNAPASMGKNMISLSPQSINISVPSDLYDSLDSLTVGTLDFAQVNMDSTHFEFDINGVLPTGCTNEDDISTLIATVNLSGMRTREFDVSNIRIDAPPSDKIVEMLTQSVRLTITGPAGEIERMTSEDITVVVNMSTNQNTLGQHEISAQIEMKNGSGCWVYGSPTVFVRITDNSASSGG